MFAFLKEQTLTKWGLSLKTEFLLLELFFSAKLAPIEKAGKSENHKSCFLEVYPFILRFVIYTILETSINGINDGPSNDWEKCHECCWASLFYVDFRVISTVIVSTSFV